MSEWITKWWAERGKQVGLHRIVKFPNGKWQASHVRGFQFETEAEATQAAELDEAEAHSFALSLRTNATGNRLLEIVCLNKAVHGFPYTTEERDFMNKLKAARANDPITSQNNGKP